MKKIFPLFVSAVLLAACVSQTPPEKETAAVSVPKTKETAAPAERLPAGNGLDSPRFGKLPPEAKDYLETLAAAFREKDRDFLVSQGEAQFEKELRDGNDDETYLALLYRSGPYSEDSAWQPTVPPRLEYTKVKALEYTAWKEKGPLLEISGLLYLEGGDTLPCGIMLVWRLTEPKILGIYPVR